MAGVTTRGRLWFARFIKFSLVIFLSALFASAAQAQFAYTNATGEIISYTTNDNTVTITGFAGINASLDVPGTIDGMPVIGLESSELFDSPTNLENVTLPNSIINIGDNIFSGCQSLTNIIIPNGITNIGDYAFAYCQSLSNIIIPDHVLSIGEAAFTDSGLVNLVIGTNVIKIETSAFIECQNLQNVTIPGRVVCIGSYAFANCSLTNLIIGTNVSNIGDDAFESCSSLSSITIPDSVTNIGIDAFGFCGPTNVFIPAGVLRIGDGAFTACGSLLAIKVDAKNPAYSSAGGILYNKDQTTLVEFPAGVFGNYSIINSVTNIEDSAFEDCNGLFTVNISSNVLGLVDCRLSSCFGLTAINVDPNNPVYQSSSGVVFDKSQKTLVEFPGGLLPFFNTTYIIPNGVTNIGDFAFYECFLGTRMGTNGIGLILPNSLLSIGNWAFFDTAVRSAVLPNSLMSIGNGAFYGFFNLTNILLPNGIVHIGNSAFYGTGLSSIDIPASMTEIESNTFGECLSLTSVIIPDGVTNIGDDAFAGCPNLTNVVFGNGISSIGNEAFLDASLITVTFPASVTSLGEFAFQCFTLTNIYFLGNAPAGDLTVFGPDPATAYYLPWTTGWGTSFGNVPAVPGSQQLVAGGGGVQTNNFNFTMVWSGSPTVIVQACTNLANPVWLPVSTNTLANGLANFSDPLWSSYPSRYYRLSSPAP